MAPRDELGDRREPVELGNSVGSDADAALTFKVVHGRVVMSHSTARLGNGSSMRFTELHCLNLSPENRFEASPLRGSSSTTGSFQRTLVCLCDYALVEKAYILTPSRLFRLEKPRRSWQPGTKESLQLFPKDRKAHQ